MKKIEKIQLGLDGPSVSKLGLGCMRMSSIWGSPTPDEKESIATIQEALDSGINFLNTGDFYGAGHNEMLIGKAIKGRRDDAFISVKFGAIFHNGAWIGMDLRPMSIKNFVNYSLTRLGIETIDLYQPSRMDNSVPVEDIIGTIADLVKEGKVRHIGVSEVIAGQLRQANAVHPISALEFGYSLADRQIEEDLLPGDLKAPLGAQNYRMHFSRFRGENLVKNLEKVEVLKQLAADKDYTPTQLATAWVKEQGEQIMPLVSMTGVIFYSYHSVERREKVCLWNDHALILQVSGSFTLETSSQTLSMEKGEMLLIGKNQVGTLRKTPQPGGKYETIVISLQETLLRKIALEEKLEADQKYLGLEII